MRISKHLSNVESIQKSVDEVSGEVTRVKGKSRKTTIGSLRSTIVPDFGGTKTWVSCLMLLSLYRSFEYDPGKREFRSQCMLRWVFRIIVIAVAGKLLNRYLESRNPHLRQTQA